MAITAADVALWAELNHRQLVPESPDVVEIGQANWYGDVPPPEGHTDDTPEASYVAARAFWAEKLRFSSLDAIDLHGQPHCWPFDLNEPLAGAGHAQYDVLINTGTAEHVFSQKDFWANCHDLVRPGGLMVHGLPWTGWINHGLYNYQPGFVLDLAEANGYEVLLFWCTSILPLKVRPVFLDAQIEGEGEHRLVLEPTESTMLHVALRKHGVGRFVPPRQSAYMTSRAPWLEVPGWLSRREGAALQALAADRRVLELGSWKGRSTCCLAESAAHVLCVDHFQGDGCTGHADVHDEWLANVRAHGHEGRVTHSRRTFEQALQSPDDVKAAAGGRIDLAFVDGEHSESGTEDACRLALACLAPRGVVAIHDWHTESVRHGAARLHLKTPHGMAGTLAWFYREGA